MNEWNGKPEQVRCWSPCGLTGDNQTLYPVSVSSTWDVRIWNSLLVGLLPDNPPIEETVSSVLVEIVGEDYIEQ